MYVVLGASGNTGHVVAKNLLAEGQKVRVVGRNALHLQPLETKGAEIFIADATDASALTKAFRGADSAYVMIPPNVTSNDIRSFQERVSDAIAAGVKNAGLRNVVSLSSFGADKPSGTGPVVGLHNLEQKLNQIDGVNLLHLRAGYFMENLLAQIGVIRSMGMTAGPLKGDLPVPMIATRDIGDYAAAALERLDFSGKQTRELLGPRDVTMREAVAAIGQAIGKPGLSYTHAPALMLKPAMVAMGMSANVVDLLLEMSDALNTGYMVGLEPRAAENSTPTTIEWFAANVFAPAFQSKAATA